MSLFPYLYFLMGRDGDNSEQLFAKRQFVTVTAVSLHAVQKEQN